LEAHEGQRQPLDGSRADLVDTADGVDGILHLLGDFGFDSTGSGGNTDCGFDVGRIPRAARRSFIRCWACCFTHAALSSAVLKFEYDEGEAVLLEAGVL
jgi:hypothetical protein